jgi:hypothetical protein
VVGHLKATKDSMVIPWFAAAGAKMLRFTFARLVTAVIE